MTRTLYEMPEQHFPCTSIYFYKMNHQHLLPIKTGHLEVFFFNSGLPFIKWGLAEAFYSDKGSPFHKGMYEGYYNSSLPIALLEPPNFWRKISKDVPQISEVPGFHISNLPLGSSSPWPSRDDLLSNRSQITEASWSWEFAKLLDEWICFLPTKLLKQRTLLSLKWQWSQVIGEKCHKSPFNQVDLKLHKCKL